MPEYPKWRKTNFCTVCTNAKTQGFYLAQVSTDAVGEAWRTWEIGARE